MLCHGKCFLSVCLLVHYKSCPHISFCQNCCNYKTVELLSFTSARYPSNAIPLPPHLTISPKPPPHASPPNPQTPPPTLPLQPHTHHLLTYTPPSHPNVHPHSRLLHRRRHLLHQTPCRQLARFLRFGILIRIHRQLHRRRRRHAPRTPQYSWLRPPRRQILQGAQTSRERRKRRCLERGYWARCGRRYEGEFGEVEGCCGCGS